MAQKLMLLVKQEREHAYANRVTVISGSPQSPQSRHTVGYPHEEVQAASKGADLMPATAYMPA